MIDSRKGVRLDLGCGSRKRHGFLGLDARDLPGVDFVRRIQDGIPLDDNSCDMVYSYHFLEHLESDPAYGVDEVRDCLSEVYRVLAPCGWIELHVPNPMSAWAVRQDHKTLMPWRNYLDLLGEIGFSGIRIHGLEGAWIEFCYPLWFVLSNLHFWFANSWMIKAVKPVEKP